MQNSVVGVTGAESNPRPVTADSPAIELIEIKRRFGDFTALAGVSLIIQRGEFVSLLGPSGCGKTTLLRIIAGLDLPDEGTLRICGQSASEIPAHKRPVNTVFQSYALFPHLTVRDNVAFGLRMKKVAEPEIMRRVNSVMEMVEITGFAERKPAQLSGGQKQRVALARAVVNEPQVLLLDEPLGALDLKLRKQLQVELRALQRRLGITFIFVTHDQEEALVMSDRIAVMNAGHIEQLGASRDIYERPRTRFAAHFLGSCNLIEATVSACADKSITVRTGFGELHVALDVTTRPLKVGDSCTLAIRPERALISSKPASTVNQFTLKVRETIYTGSETQYHLTGENVALQVWALNSDNTAAFVQPGHDIMVELPANALIVLDN